MLQSEKSPRYRGLNRWRRRESNHCKSFALTIRRHTVFPASARACDSRVCYPVPFASHPVPSLATGNGHHLGTEARSTPSAGSVLLATIWLRKGRSHYACFGCFAVKPQHWNYRQNATHPPVQEPDQGPNQKGTCRNGARTPAPAEPAGSALASWPQAPSPECRELEG